MSFLGELSALLTACLWSGGAIAFAAASQRVGSFQVNITRLILATAYLAVLIAVMRFDISLSNRQLIYLGISGFIGLSIGDTFLFKAFQEIGARVSMLIMSLAPAFASFLAYLLLGESLSVVGVLGIAITIAGVSIVVFDRKRGSAERVSLTTFGIVCAVLAAVGQGAGLVFAKMAFRDGEVNGFVATAVRIIASLVLLIPVGVLTKRYTSPLRMLLHQRKALMFTAIGSVLGPFLGISFSLIAIKHTDVGVAATIMALVPIIMLPMAMIVYKEKLTWRAILGASTAVAGVAVLFLR